MCIVFLAFQVNPDTPVMLGANREESRRRPTTSPVCTRNGSVRCLLAGADQGPEGTFPAIGTWLGINDGGLVVAVTNRRDGELEPQHQVRSRGLLAVSLLGLDDAESAARLARNELTGGGFGGCNYLIVNDRVAWIVQAPGAAQVAVEKLSPGIHAMTNLALDDGTDPRIRFVYEHLEPERFVTSAQRICRHDSIVIAGEQHGTVSSSLILIGAETRFLHLMGDPRQGDYTEFRPFQS